MADIPTDTGTPEGRQIVSDKKLYVSQEQWDYDNVQFKLFGRNPIDKTPVAARVIFEKYEPFSYDISPPSFSLSIDEARQLMNQMWQRGIRPSEAPPESTEALRATEKHLGDMQRITNRLLDKVLDKE